MPSLCESVFSAARSRPFESAMKIVLVIVGCLVALVAAFEIVCRIISKRERALFDKMTPEERLRYQDDMCKAEL